MVNKQSKSKKKKFIRQDFHKKKRLAKKWRKPRGIDSKKRLMKNNRVIVKPGYGTPKEEKHKFNGMELVHVSSADQIKELDPKKQRVIVSGKLGLKKKLPLLKKLIEKKMQIHNFPDAEKYVEEKEDILRKKKEHKKEAEKKEKEEQKKKEAKVKEADKKKRLDEKVDEDVSEEEKKKTEKEEIDKLLTKKKV